MEEPARHFQQQPLTNNHTFEAKPSGLPHSDGSADNCAGHAIDTSAQSQPQSGQQISAPALSQQQPATKQQRLGPDQPLQHLLNQPPAGSRQQPQQLQQQLVADRQQQQQQSGSIADPSMHLPFQQSHSDGSPEPASHPNLQLPQQLLQPSHQQLQQLRNTPPSQLQGQEHQQEQQLSEQLLQPSHMQLDPIGTLRAGRISGDSPHPAGVQPTATSTLHPPSVADPHLDSHPVTDPLSQHGPPLPRPFATLNESYSSDIAAAMHSKLDPHEPQAAASQSPTASDGLVPEAPAKSAPPQPEKSALSAATREHPQLASEPGVRGESDVSTSSPGRRRPQRVATPQVLQQLPSERGLGRVTPLATLAERSEDGTPSLTDAESSAAGMLPTLTTPLFMVDDKGDRFCFINLISLECHWCHPGI